MKYILALTFAVFSLTACGPRVTTHDIEVDVPVTVAPPPPTVQEDVLGLLADENTYRLSLGQTMLSGGLSCTLYTFASGDRIQASIAGHNTLTPLTSKATFLLNSTVNQGDSSASTGLNILPTAIRPLYSNMYMVRCTGQIVLTETGYHSFSIASDDGSLLYVDGGLLIDNDNNHGILEVGGMKNMRRGVHAFRFDFAQSGGGNQALVIKMDGQLINPILLAH